MLDVFIIGSKGIPSNYGGFETFVDQLTKNKINEQIKYHVSCMSDQNGEFECNNSRCFNVKTPDIGPAKAVIYDILSLDNVYNYIKKNNIKNAIVYILACRIGPFIGYYKTKFEKLGVPIYLNPDGHEWKRAKWNYLIRKYWKLSEKLMIKNTDLIICDSLAIEEYIKKEYQKFNPVTTFIAYGASINEPDNLDMKKYNDWLNKWELRGNDYYLIVGRFVPENNYELIIKEFMKSDTQKKLIIVSNIEHNKFYKLLSTKTQFYKDKRIEFVGTIYDQNLLYLVRKNAFAYFHGHEVGGTNPSLLEAMATTSLNILLDVKFNSEVGGEGALYFNKTSGSLARTIKLAEKMNLSEIEEKSFLAKKRIEDEYSWETIVQKYEMIFTEGKIN